ncbi:gamma-glutamyl-phosphate reductase, partial [Bacillus atrophaeus]|nr:gamma-glutamyl-phosphate reductase [Bacillus atrophaeus]
MSEVSVKAKLANEAAAELIMKTTAEKDEALSLIANGLRKEIDFLLMENAKDIENGTNNGLTPDIIDRLTLDEKRIRDIADAVELLIDLADPVGPHMGSSDCRGHNAYGYI